MAEMEIILRLLLEDQDARAEERYRQSQLEIKRSIETIIAQHIQSLHAIIVQERPSRVQTILEVQ